MLTTVGSTMPLSAPASIAKAKNASFSNRLFGSPEADVAHAAGDVDLGTEAPAQLGDRVEAVPSVLAVDGDREDKGVDEDLVELDTCFKRRFDHPAGVGDALLGVRRHSRLAGGGDHDGSLSCAANSSASMRSSEAELSIGGPTRAPAASAASRLRR
jgi:hypothetical protein